MGIELGIVKKAGAFHSFGDQRLGQGRENSREFLRQNPELAAEIERQIRQQTAAPRVTTPPADAEMPLPEGLADLVEQPAF